MKSYKGIIIGLLVITLPVSAWAQDKNDSVTIQGQTIHITQIYEPKVKRPEKPVLIPTLPPPDTARPLFKYFVPAQTLKFTYHSIPLRPLALEKPKETSLYQNYIKAGAGNRSSLYLDAGIGSLRGKNYSTSFHATHINQKGTIENQQVSFTKFSAAGNYYTAGHVFSTHLNIRNRRHRFYGYDNETYHYNSSAIQQSLTDGFLLLKAENVKKNNSNIDYQPAIGFGIFGDNFSGRQSRLYFNLPAQWHFGALPGKGARYAPFGKISLGLEGNLVHFENARVSRANDLLQIKPALDLHIEHVAIHAGLTPAFDLAQNFYLLPDIHVRAGIAKNKIFVRAGFKSNVAQNTYLDLSLINPFMDNVFAGKQSRMDKAFLGLTATAGKFFTIGATGSWHQWKNMPLFINNYSHNPDGKKFDIVYSPLVRAFALDGFARYQPSDFIGFCVHGAWFYYYKQTNGTTIDIDAPWGYPTLTLNAAVKVHPFKKLFLKANMGLMNGISTRTAMGVTNRLPSFADISIDGEYNIISRLSIFLQVNNILNQTYQRWHQYPVLGINILGGVRFKF